MLIEFMIIGLVCLVGFMFYRVDTIITDQLEMLDRIDDRLNKLKNKLD